MVGEDCTEHQVCNEYNRGDCKHQEDPYCTWILEITDTEKRLVHVCSFVLPCCGMLCGSKEHSAIEHELLPAHCWVCYNTMFAFRGWIEKKRDLKVKDVVLVETKSKIGKGLYHMARVIQTHPDTKLTR